MIPLCLEQGIGVIPWSPLARGLLARPRPPERTVTSGISARARSDRYSPRLYDWPSDWEVVGAVEQVAAKRGVSMAEVALAWLLQNPAVTAPIVGATKPEHLEAAIKAVDLRLEPEDIDALEAPYQPHPVRGIEA